MPTWQEYLQQNRDRFQQELVEFGSIPSISALPAHAEDVQRAAQWVSGRLQAAGAEHVAVYPTKGHPVVYGDWLHAPGKQTILIYGHFDVQPVDPIDLWTTPPFQPTVRDGRIYARGISDNKGNMLLAIVGFEALLKTAGKLPVNVKFLFEGEEETGSPGTPAFVEANKDKLACDMVLNSDGGQHSETEPSLGVGLRGICELQIDVWNAKSDLHSGTYGGAVANPLHALAALLASMHAEDGRIAVEGFYDDVVTLTSEERAQIAAVPFDEKAIKAEIGVEELFGEPGYSTNERTWVRPTLEINGFWGGFQGEGMKTVLPREAHAKISCRLVPHQDPAKIMSAVEAHVQKHQPRGVKVSVSRFPTLAPAYLVPADHPGNQTVAAVLRELYGREPYHERSGGSVPICEVFRQQLGVYSISLGFGLDDEGFHAPNEFFRLSSFQRGQQAYARVLEKLGE